MGKHADELGSYSEFRAPWETETGDEAEIDKGKLKKLLFNARSAKAAALDERDEATESLAAAQKELETAKAEAADANGAEAQKKIDRLEKKVEDLTTERDKLVSDKEEADLRAEVLGDLDPKYAKYVKGSTREELEKSLEEIKEDFGLSNESGDEEEGDEDEPTVRTTPRVRVKNAGDPKGTEVPAGEYDFDKVADDIVGTSVFH